MSIQNSNDRLMRVMQATPEQLTAIDRVLEGGAVSSRPERAGPYLLPMGKAATLLGVSRATLWRMIQSKKLARVEVLPGSFRVRRDEVEAIAFGENGEHRTSNIEHPTSNGGASGNGGGK